MSEKAEKLIKKIQQDYSVYFEDHDPEKELNRAGKGAINSIRALLDNFTEYNRFIEEMIQNAEDSESSEIVFHIDDNEILVENDGRLFAESDVESITTVGDSTKMDSDSIGMFGLGFKSVFLLSDTPKIYSGEFDFSFKSKNLIWPYLEIKPSKFNPKRTYVVLPLKRNSTMEILRSIRSYYGKIAELVLFLKNLKRIIIKDSRLGEIIFEKRKTQDIISLYKIENDSRTLINKWIVISDDYRIDKECIKSLKADDRRRRKEKINVDLAFKVSASNDLIYSTNNVLYSFLSTKYATHLPFIINSDFHLTGNREGIKEYSEWNKFILDCATDLFQKSIDYFKKSHDYKYTFYGIIPQTYTCPEDKPILRSFYDKIIEWCKKSAIVITESDAFKKGEFCYFDDKNIKSVISNDLLIKYDNKEYVSTKIPSDFRQIISTFGISYFDKRLIPFLKDNPKIYQKNNQLIMALYSKLYEIFGQQKILSAIKDLELMKLDTDQFVDFNSMIENPVYYINKEMKLNLLFNEGVEQRIINKEIWSEKTKDINLKYFFDLLINEKYLQEYNINSYILSLLKKFGNEEKSLFEVTLFIKQNMDKINDETKSLLRKRITLKSNDGTFLEPSTLFIPEIYGGDLLFDELSKHFKNFNVISKEYIKYDKDKASWYSFFRMLYANIVIPCEVTSETIGTKHDHVKSIETYSSKRLNLIFKSLEELDKKNRILLAQLIFKNIDENISYYKDKLKVVYYEEERQAGRHVDNEEIQIETKFLKILKDNMWLPSSNMDLCYPEDIYLDLKDIRDYDPNLPRLNVGYAVNKNSVLAGLLGIRSELDASVYVAKLKKIQETNKEVNLVDIEEIYELIGKQIHSDDTKKVETIKELFTKHSLIYAPSKDTILWLEPKDSFLKPDQITKGYISALSSFYTKPGALKLFKEILGIAENPIITHYLTVLRIISKSSLSDKDKSKVFQIYVILNEELGRETEPEWWQDLISGDYLLSQRNNFCNYKSIYYDDNSLISEGFENDIDFLFVPDEKSKEKIHLFVDKLNLCKLSEEVTRSIITNHQIKELKILHYFTDINGYTEGISNYISKHYNHSVKINNTSLKNINIVFTDKITIKFTLRKISKEKDVDWCTEPEKRLIYLKYFKDSIEIPHYKKSLSKAIAEIYNLPPLSDHLYKLIQECVIENNDLVEFYKSEGVKISKFHIEDETPIREKESSKGTKTKIVVDIYDKEEEPKEPDKKKRSYIEDEDQVTPKKPIKEVLTTPKLNEIVKPSYSGKPQKGQFNISDKEKQAYYRTKEWKEIQEKCFNNSDYKCDECGSEEDLQAHHLTYENWGNETVTDLKCVCRSCHEKIHGKILPVNDMDYDKLSKISEEIKKKEIAIKRKEKELEIKEAEINEQENVRKGRTLSPNSETSFKDIFRGLLGGKKPPKQPVPQAIIESDEPLSLEEIDAIKEKAETGLSSEIRRIRDVNRKRTYTKILKGISEDITVNEDVRTTYNGKCQICGSTFRKKDGNNYAEIVKIIPLKYQGTRFIGNSLCLCANHAAMWKHAPVELDLENIKNDILTIKINGKKEIITFKPIHFVYFKTMIREDDEQ
ncbi:MAG: sacsin N-terminal ATP-binding-like domain-containing protein [Candidatus Woesearchaeota archaeon]